jgi:hypothetical protein
MKVSKELIQAIACAVAVMEGTAGGYSAQEKMRAKMVLLRFFNDHAKDAE